MLCCCGSGGDERLVLLLLLLFCNIRERSGSRRVFLLRAFPNRHKWLLRPQFAAKRERAPTMINGRWRLEGRLRRRLPLPGGGG